MDDARLTPWGVAGSLTVEREVAFPAEARPDEFRVVVVFLPALTGLRVNDLSKGLRQVL
jgi:hypothetical protein